jgi:serine/threonine-protein kinase
MSDDTLSGERSTERKLHSELLSGLTTQNLPEPEPPPRSLSTISVPPSMGRLIPGHQLGRYELLCPIARGGMASVWVARLQGAHGFEKLVAVKTILAEHAADPAYEAMFLDEARIVAGIRHHNVAEILHLGSADGMLYLVLEWVEGDSLALLQRAAARQREPLPVTVAMRIVAQICAGLHAAHELTDRNGKLLNVVHRDVSPQNVIVSATGEVKLIDFGIAKAVDQLSEHTRTGVLKGKISFMAPEQALGQKVDRRADVWAAGVVLYQLLSGRLPYRGENQLETLHLISRKGRAPAIAGLPKPLAHLLERALEPELEQRISSAAELEVELERLIGVMGAVTTREVAAVVQKYLGRRIAARRNVVETALRAADGRIELTQAFNAALEPHGLPDDEASSMVRRQQATTQVETPLAGNELTAELVTAAVPVMALPRQRAGLRHRGWLVAGATLLLVGLVVALTWRPATLTPAADAVAPGPNAAEMAAESQATPARAPVSQPPAVQPPSEPPATGATLGIADAVTPPSDPQPARTPQVAKPRRQAAARVVPPPSSHKQATAPAAAGASTDVLKAFGERR